MKKTKSKLLTRRIHFKVSPIEYKNLIMLAQSTCEGNISLYIRRSIKIETLLFLSKGDVLNGAQTKFSGDSKRS